MAPCLPVEIWTEVAKYVRHANTDYFDPLITRDLHSLRLASRQLCQIVTPLLYQSLVWGLKSWSREDVNRVLQFAGNHPHLAKHVRCLRILVPNEYLMDEASQWSRSLSRKDFKTLKNTVDSLTTCWKTSSTANPIAMDKILEALPRLFHIENGLSTHVDDCLGKIHQRLSDKMAMKFPEIVSHDPKDLFHYLSRDGLCLGSDLLLQSWPSQISSLKLQGVFFCGKTRQGVFPPQLEHLDLSFVAGSLGVADYISDGEMDDMEMWRTDILSLKHLKILRLAWDERNTNQRVADDYRQNKHFEDFLDEPFGDTRTPTSSNNMPDSSDAQSSKPTLAPLTSFALFNCHIDNDGLTKLLKRYSDTLTELKLAKVSFCFHGESQSLADLADIYKATLPHLTHLQLSELSEGFGDEKTEAALPMSEELGSDEYEWYHGDDLEPLAIGDANDTEEGSIGENQKAESSSGEDEQAESSSEEEEETAETTT